ncbi:MAG: hypothetical protein JRI68_33540, partial [Deltaproteobacteria bacterium]|nr:hypothetical protein [Deltaproteobacteria bacterium]
IDYDEDPEFSKAFVLQGEVEIATRKLFDREVRRRMMRLEGSRLQVEADKDRLLIHEGWFIKPSEVQRLLVKAIGIHRILAHEDEEKS